MYDVFRKFGSLLSCIVLLGIAAGAMAAGPKAYVGNFSDSTVSVIDTATGTVVATVPVSTGPHGMAITPDGRMAYVSGDGASRSPPSTRRPTRSRRRSRSANPRTASR